MTMRRPLSQRQILFSELRGVLVALRGLHGRVKGQAARPNQSTDTSPEQRPPTQTFQSDVAWTTGRRKDGAFALDSFAIDEDPDHLEEAVLIYMDELLTTEESDLRTRNRRFRLDVDGTSFAELQCDSPGRVHEMQLRRIDFDGPMSSENKSAKWPSRGDEERG